MRHGINLTLLSYSQLWLIVECREIAKVAPATPRQNCLLLTRKMTCAFWRVHLRSNQLVMILVSFNLKAHSKIAILWINWIHKDGHIIIYWSFLIPVKNWFKFCRTLLHIFINRDNLSHISTHTVHSTLVMGPTTCHQRVSISYMHVLHSYRRSHHLLYIMEVVIVAVHVLWLITCSQLLLLRLCNLLLACVRPLFPTYATGIHLRCCLKHLTVCHCVLLFLMVGLISYHLMLVLKLTLVKIHSWYINTILLRVYLVTT